MDIWPPARFLSAQSHAAMAFVRFVAIRNRGGGNGPARLHQGNCWIGRVAACGEGAARPPLRCPDVKQRGQSGGAILACSIRSGTGTAGLASKYKLVANRKTASASGLVSPPSLL